MNRDLLDDRAAALRVRCPDPPFGCSAPIGERCTRPDGYGGRAEYEHFAAHIPRLKLAGVLHAPLDSRDLRRGD